MKKITRPFLLPAVLFAGLVGGEISAEVAMTVHRDLPYAEPKNERQCLDVYEAGVKGQKSTVNGENSGKSGRPVVVWIHGGGWHQGDKSELAVGTPEQHSLKPQAIVGRGGVFVALSYRFVPNVDLKTMTGDVAKAIGWVKRHVAEYGGDPESIFVMGHSAGAQLAALVCTDERYLAAEGMTLRDIKGCMPVDGAAYYPALQAEGSDPAKSAKFRKAFPENTERELAAVAHIAKDKGIPPFLVLCLADRPESHSKLQSEILVHYLTLAGVPAKVVPIAGKTHATLNADLGLPGDAATKAMMAFMDEVMNKR